MRCVALFAALACAGCYFPTYVEEERWADYGDPLSRAEVEKLLAAGVSDAVIVEKAKKSGALKLTADDIVALKKAGATDELVKELIAAERRPVERPVYVPSRSYYVYDYSDCWWGWPSLYFGYSHHHHHYRRPRAGVGIRVGW